MNKRSIALIAILLLPPLLVPAAGVAAAGPDEASLVAAWEAALRADPTTEVLLKTAEKTYHFKTKLFPFDGELRVLNALIQDYGDEESMPGFATGSVEVELVGFTQEQMTRYARSYAYWYQLHTLFFDHRAERWLTAKEYRSAAMAKFPGAGRNSFVAWLGQNYFLLILVLLALFLWWLTKKSGRQVKSALARQDEAMEITRRSIALSEKAVQLNEEANRLLQEILRELKGRNPQ
jgi:hypothetical protein